MAYLKAFNIDDFFRVWLLSDKIYKLPYYIILISMSGGKFAKTFKDEIDRIKSIIREDLAKDNIAPEMKKHWLQIPA